ncbi:MAG: ribonuclease P protein component [Bdellovibrionales bacterium]
MAHTELKILKKRAEFLAVAALRKRWVTPAFIVQVAPRKNDPESCGYGLTASKKMVGCAVNRNRAKRRLRALMRDMLPRFSLAGHNLVIIAKEDILSCDYEQLRRDLRWALKRLSLSS